MIRTVNEKKSLRPPHASSWASSRGAATSTRSRARRRSSGSSSVQSTRSIRRVTSRTAVSGFVGSKVSMMTTLSIFKSQYHEPVKFPQVERFVDKGERTVRERLVLRLRDRTP